MRQRYLSNSGEYAIIEIDGSFSEKKYWNALLIIFQPGDDRMHVNIVMGVFALACWAVFIVLFRKDRSRYRNCYALLLALTSSFLFYVIAVGPFNSLTVLIPVYGILLSILIVPFFLIYNGIVMIRKEGRHLSQLLSLAFGTVILAGEAIAIAGVFRYSFGGPEQVLIPKTFLSVAGAVFSVSVIYGSASFVVFMLYTLFLQIIPSKKDFDFVIIHGAGLLDGDRVSKLLRDRMDKAIEVYRQDPTPPKLIPSGGQGANETISEAEAMKRYLISQGIPESDILPEDKSTTTLENLQFSKRIVDSFEGRKYTALVSSNYHIFRALRYCRKIGLQCTGIGSHIAFYFWPSALIREYIAVHTEKKIAVIFIAGWMVCMMVLMAIIFK